jgi:glycosyltransferase involved in cell wall biosynthesis
MDIKPKVSVILPVYNAELYIEKCARSWFEQTFKEVEYIFVDDNTPDGSILILKKVIEEYPERKDQVTIISHYNNRGVAAARNTGLEQARGEYFLQVDSDDWVEKTLIEELYSEVKINGPDIVWSDFYVDLPKFQKVIYKNQTVTENSESCIINMLSGSLHAGMWNKLINLSVCTDNNIRFPEGVNICEDLVFNIFYLLHAGRISYVPKAFYHYVQNANSITISRTHQSFESEFRAVKILEENIPPEIYGKYLLMYKARIKRNMFFSGLFSNEEYLNCFPESTSYIFNGINFVDRSSLWFSLKRMYLFARVLLFIGQIYTGIKTSFIYRN